MIQDKNVCNIKSQFFKGYKLTGNSLGVWLLAMISPLGGASKYFIFFKSLIWLVVKLTTQTHVL